MRIVATRPAVRCGLCHDDLAPDALLAVCAGCELRGHLDCVVEARRCPSLGCTRPARIFASSPRSSAPVPRAWWRRIAALALALACVMGIACRVHDDVCAHVGYLGYRHLKRMRGDMRAINDALDLYKVDCGRYPDQLHDLWVRPPDVKRWGPEPYLKEYPPRDPWGNEYLYRSQPGARPELFSLGADGRTGCSCVDEDHTSRSINDETW